jgi:cathepsin D
MTPVAAGAGVSGLLGLNGDTTPVADFRVSYGSGEASGVLLQDKVTMAGYTVPNQTFASCHEITDGLLAGPVSGIMGLGCQPIASSNATPWWENLARTGQLGVDQEMGFAFTRFLHNSASADTVMPGGVASFGSANRTLYTGGEANQVCCFDQFDSHTDF